MLIVIDGPEAAGKTTFISQTFPNAVRRPWGPVSSATEYIKQLDADRSADHLVVWDRSWASEYVYNILMNRGRKEQNVMRLLEEMRIPRIMILAYPDTLKMRRDFRLAAGLSDDLPVDPSQEFALFRDYAMSNCWSLHWTEEVRDS